MKKTILILQLLIVTSMRLCATGDTDIWIGGNGDWDSEYDYNGQPSWSLVFSPLGGDAVLSNGSTVFAEYGANAWNFTLINSTLSFGSNIPNFTNVYIAGGTVQSTALSSYTTSWNDVTIGTGGATIEVNGATNVFNLSDNLSSLPGTSGSLTKTGDGVLSLENTDIFNFHGPININGGTLLINGSYDSPIDGALNIDGGTLRSTSAYVVVDNGINDMHIGSGGATFDVPDANVLDVADNISNLLGTSGSLTKIGTGTLRLYGTSYTGTTTVSSGTITQTGGDSSGSLGIIVSPTVGATATYNLQGGSLSTGSITVNSGGTFSVADNGVLDTRNAAPHTVSYTNTAGGTFQPSIMGVGNGQFGQLRVSGTATLDGLLSPDVPGYTPPSGSQFPVLTSATITGTFNAGRPLLAAGGTTFRVAYGSFGTTGSLGPDYSGTYPSGNGQPTPQQVTLFANPTIVTLQFAMDAPFGVTSKLVAGRTEYYKDPNGSLTAAMPSLFYQTQIAQAVQGIFDSNGIHNIVIALPYQETDAELKTSSNVYFVNALPPQVLGVTGVNQMNKDDAQPITVKYTGSVAKDEITVAHEIGHSLGLQDIYDPSDKTIMHFAISANTPKSFAKGSLPAGDTGLLSNQLYYLLRYTEKISDFQLQSEGIYPASLPGSYDQMFLHDVPYKLSFQAFASIHQPSDSIYNVEILETGVDGIDTEIGQYDSLTLSALSDMTFSLTPGQGLTLFGASVPNGPLDLMLLDANGNDTISPTSQDASLTLDQFDASGDATVVATGALQLQSTPEPCAVAFLGIGFLAIIHRRERKRRNPVSPAHREDES